MIKLIVTDSYFNLFPLLSDLLKEKAKSPEKKNLVFCEAKFSLMAERFICGALKGSFNTDVYSFGKFLRAKKPLEKLLSKEGSAMAIKRVINNVQLKCFKQSRQNLAPTLYDLIIQLKSAKVTPNDILSAQEKTHGVLKNKLADIGTIFSEYEKYLNDGGYDDQSSMLSFLPEVINQSEEIKNADVFLVGYGSFTAQMRSAVDALLINAKSVTAILVDGNNPNAYVGETAQYIKDACNKLNLNLMVNRVDGGMIEEAKAITKNLFYPATKIQQFNTQKISALKAETPAEEVMRVGEIIRNFVLSGKYRYSDMTIAVNDVAVYKDYIKAYFSALEIPFFLDEQKVSDTHPLVAIILAYYDIKRKGMERNIVAAFFKNPLFCADKNLSDAFENYIIKYNVNYNRFYKPFTFPADEGVELSQLENLRIKLVDAVQSFDERSLLNNLNAEQTLLELSTKLKSYGDFEDCAVSEQIYQAVLSIFEQMDMILGKVEMSVSERKNVFLSGVSALKLSIIPQYNDAVFIGGFKECSLAKAKNLFVVGLTTAVPTVQADVALLSDNDINALETVKILVEPKIRVVNHRERESAVMALSAFSDNLFISYPQSTVDGKNNKCGEIFTTLYKLFTCKNFPKYNGFTAYLQGVSSFAKACGEFAEGATEKDKHYDFSYPTAFYTATDKEKLQSILDGANKQVRVKLNNCSLVKNVTSPTTVEDYYKCPYYAFISHSLRIRARDDGEVGVLSVGNLMHEILSRFVYDLKGVTDKQSSDARFESITEKVLSRDEYKKFLSDTATNATVKRVLLECKDYCYKTYCSLKKSGFNKTRTEVGFGDGDKAEYPAIPLMDGKVRLKGKIDRVDEGDKYFRVLDYKTGKTDPSEKALFAGVKLQLYLYAAAVMKKYQGDQEKFPSGLYYLPVSDKYEKPEEKVVTLAVGKTLSEKEALITMDKEFFDNGQTDFSSVKVDAKGTVKNGVDRDMISACINYAVNMSEKAVKNMADGVIIASPFEGACKYCEYSSLCGLKDPPERKVNSCGKDVFIDALKGETE